MRSLPFSIILFCFSSIIYSQTDLRPGYVITNDLDTIYGLVDYRGDIRNMKFCSFQQEGQQEIKQFNPKEIFGYRFNDGKYYVSKYINNEHVKDTVLVEFLLKGIRSLYFYKSADYYAYFIDSEEYGMIELESNDIAYEKDGVQLVGNNKKYIGLLTYALKDCPELKSDINNSVLTHKSLINITKKYHDYKCDDESCIIYEKEQPILSVLLMPYIGYAITTYKVQDPYIELFDFDASHSLVGGLDIQFIVPRLNERLTLFTKVQINKDEFHGYYNEQRIGLEYNNYATIKNTRLLTGGGLQYTYPKRKFRPSLGIGLYKDWSLGGDAGFYRETIYADQENVIYEGEINDVNNSKIGFILKIGGMYKIKNIKVFVNFSYLSGRVEIGGQQESLVRPNEINNTFQLSTGIVL
ncbi:hypothetical protein [Carboxylicivirga caseinilyticus]|uniref:hypothetical protein n=1 Tax=Carboxylicivirga caseinilyticus TaxID=3417572 RepID=UPI003D3389B6|nr:hypothetical protein [Marinilabiliaceae bacterium A049]